MMIRTKKIKRPLISIFMLADGVDKFLMIVGFLGAAGDGISTPASFLIGSKIFNHVGNGNTNAPSQNFSQNINQMVSSLCYIGCAKWISCFLEGYCWTRTAERQASTLRARYLKAVLRQDVGYFDLHVTSIAEVIECVSSDGLVIQEVISEKLPMLLMNLWMFVGSYVVAFLMVWRLAIVGVPLVIFLVIPGIIYGRAQMVIARKIRNEYSKAGSIVEQAVSSIRTVYSYVGENKSVAEYSAALEGAFRLGLRQGLAKGLAIGSNGIVFAIWSFMSYYGSRLVMYHGAQGGLVYSVCASVVVGGLALGSGLSYVRFLSEANAAAERILETIERVPEIDSENMEGEVLGNVSGEVEFRNVEFAYPSRPESAIFKDFNLKIPAGRTVALVGESGSGKSTAIALLQRFYDPLAGDILLDRVAINKLQIKFLRSQMGLVSQEPVLFATTIRENILFGKEAASIDEVVEAAKASNAHTFISQLPQGYDTQVGEGGVQMSGGQKQRIAIARAIIKAPKILLLDEATSALDSESERIVQQALDKAAVGRSTIIIAHLLSTIRNADLIAVVQDGHVMETGSHDELVGDENGLYASLIRLQQTQTTNQVHETSATAILASSGSIISRTISANSVDPCNQAAENVNTSLRVPSFRRLLAMNSLEWRQALAGCISAALSGAIQPTYALAQGSVILAYFLPDHREIKEKIRMYSMFIAGLAVFSVLTGICQHYSFAVMGEFLTKRIRQNMFSKILTFEIGWFNREENSTGAICSRLSKDANVVRSLVGDRMALLVQTISGVTIAFTIGVIIAWKFALALVAIQPLIMISVYWRRVLLKTMSEKSIKAQEESSKIAAEAVSNLRTVAAFSSESRILRMLEKAQQAPRRESIRQSWFAGIGLGMSNSLVIINWGFGFWYGAKLMDSGSLGSEALFQCFIILISTGRVIAEAAAMTNDLAKGSDAVKSVFAVLDRFSLIEPEDQKSYKPDDLTGHVELRGVDFAYPSRPDVMIFKEFSLKIEAGKSTALVGQSGSGKSTIINLIERFYDPIKGSVEIDCKDIRSYHLRALRKHIALVSQEPALFAGTVRQNIVYGASETIGESEIIEASKIANAHDFITGLKDGYDTWCGDKGLQLSGGQKQRIAIARAVLKNPTILLLDEATSALDSQSEKVVQDALEKVMAGRTSVVVAHRLSTIRGCDTIAVLDEGRVIEKGTHSDLLELGQDGVYSSLVSLQTTNTPSSN